MMRGGRQMRDRARKSRGEMTDPEQLLWRALRRNQLTARFRRQFRIPPFVVDFAGIEARLIVECDGGQHAQSATDARREAELYRRGWRVLRFWNNDIIENRDGVLQAIADALGSWSARYP